MLQNVLEANNIFVQVKNGLMSSIEPWAVTAGGFGAAEVLVPKDDYDVALKILEYQILSVNVIKWKLCRH